MNDPTTLIGLTECISLLTEKQGIILELLANKLPNLTENEKAGLLKSADENYARLKDFKLAVDALRGQ